MRLGYELVGSGWAEITIECSGQRVQFLASYLSDCLKDLATQATNIAHGAVEGYVDFLDEPGEHRLSISRVDEKNISMEIWEYQHWVPMHPSATPVACKLTCKTSAAHLRGQVHSAMGRLLEKHGVDGYQAKWANAPFPMAEYQRLQRAVA
jgi:hypothetical protein